MENEEMYNDFERVILMHEDTPVADCIIGPEWRLIDINEVFDDALMPVIAQKEDNRVQNLQKWINLRKVFCDRPEIKNIVDFFGNTIINSVHLESIFDRYWFCVGLSEKWEDISPRKKYSIAEDELFNVLMWPKKTPKDCEDDIDFSSESPNLTLGNSEARIWYREEDGTLSLLYFDAIEKMGEYKAATENGIVLKDREYFVYNDHLFAKVPCQLDDNTECIPFEEYLTAYAGSNASDASELIECCKHYQINGWKEFIGDIVRLDDATGREDRDLGSILVVRDANTLKPLRFFDI